MSSDYVVFVLTEASKLAEEELEFSETSESDNSELDGMTSDEENCNVLPPKTSQTNEVTARVSIFLQHL